MVSQDPNVKCELRNSLLFVYSWNMVKANLKRKFHTWISSNLVKGTEYEAQDLASSTSWQPKQFEKQCAYLSTLDSSLSRRQFSGSSEANILWLCDWFCHYCSWNTGVFGSGMFTISWIFLGSGSLPSFETMNPSILPEYTRQTHLSRLRLMQNYLHIK